MIVDVFYHLLIFDLPWVATLILANLHYLFAFAAIAFFNARDKLMFFLMLTVYMWGTAGFTSVTGLIVLTGGFLSLHYIVRAVLMILVEDVKSLQPKLVPLLVLEFFVLVIIYNLFLI